MLIVKMKAWQTSHGYYQMYGKQNNSRIGLQKVKGSAGDLMSYYPPLIVILYVVLCIALLHMLLCINLFSIYEIKCNHSLYTGQKSTVLAFSRK